MDFCEQEPASLKGVDRTWTRRSSERSTPPSVERLPYPDRECRVMARATLDFYYCNSGRLEKMSRMTGRKRRSAAPACTLSVSLPPDTLLPLPSSALVQRRRPLCVSHQSSFNSLMFILQTRSQHFICRNLVCGAAAPAARRNQPGGAANAVIFLPLLPPAVEWRHCFEGNGCTKAHSYSCSRGKVLPECPALFTTMSH